MSKVFTNYLLMLIIGFLISGCGIEDESKASQRNVQPKDVVGTWIDERSATGKASVATLALDIQGAFTITSSFDDAGYGTWKIGDDNTLVFIYRNKDAVNSTWYMADDPKGGFTIVGSTVRGLPLDFLKKGQ